MRLALFLVLSATSLLPQQPETPAPDRWKAVRDVVYVPYGISRQKLDLYIPPASGKIPLVIWIHGGAWRSGDKSNPLPLRLIADQPYAIASIDYRPSSQAKFSAQIEDCKAAIRWLRAHAGEYSLDPDRFAVWGSSAGGHLAALVGTSGGKFDLGENLKVSSRVQAVIDYYGPTNFLEMDSHALPSAPFKHDAADSPESALVGGPIRENEVAVARADPSTYASKDDPPFLIVHGDQDPQVPHHQSVLLEAALKKAGVPVTLHTVAGGGHGDGFDQDPAVVPLVKSFLAKAFGR